MKKFLLIAAMAALALGASAQDYKLEKVWEINDVSFLPTLDSRQGFGMNGKFYINNKKQSVDTVDGVEIVTVPTIYEVDENGLTGVTFDGGRNCAITHDEAGNIIREEHFDESGMPTAFKDGYYVLVREYNEAGKVTHEEYLNADIVGCTVDVRSGAGNACGGILPFSISPILNRKAMTGGKIHQAHANGQVVIAAV